MGGGEEGRLLGNDARGRLGVSACGETPGPKTEDRRISRNSLRGVRARGRDASRTNNSAKRTCGTRRRSPKSALGNVRSLVFGCCAVCTAPPIKTATPAQKDNQDDDAAPAKEILNVEEGRNRILKKLGRRGDVPNARKSALFSGMDLILLAGLTSEMAALNPKAPTLDCKPWTRQR